MWAPLSRRSPLAPERNFKLPQRKLRPTLYQPASFAPSKFSIFPPQLHPLPPSSRLLSSPPQSIVMHNSAGQFWSPPWLARGGTWFAAHHPDIGPTNLVLRQRYQPGNQAPRVVGRAPSSGVSCTDTFHTSTPSDSNRKAPVPLSPPLSLLLANARA